MIRINTEIDAEIKSELKRSIKQANSTIEIIDELMQARDELFELQLKKGLEPHKKLSSIVLK